MILAVKRLLKNHLSSRMQYNLWFLLLVLLVVPFLPPGLSSVPDPLSWLSHFHQLTGTEKAAVGQAVSAAGHSSAVDWMHDFTLSVSRETPFGLSTLILSLWLGGILVMGLVAVKSRTRLCLLKHSALPLQNRDVSRLFIECRRQLKISRNIPVYSTAYLMSPVITGFLALRIYIPLHLISDFCEDEMRYMLLHELQHYRHRDALVNVLANLAGIIYWFNPLVWHALGEMRIDREIACDSSVLQILDKDSYAAYGNTLINFAEKLSFSPFPFSTGMGGGQKQIKRRILNIASYQPPSRGRKLRSTVLFCLICVLLLGLSPVLSSRAALQEYGSFRDGDQKVSYIDCSSYFDGYQGSFVLYDEETGGWQIYNREYASLRVSPDSTYKIYAALQGLESGTITTDDTRLAWDKKDYPFDAWNADQDLNSAMKNSVNWYFQTLDQHSGRSAVSAYLQEIGYGNENMDGGLSTYWLESSLKISPIEQVELLRQFYHNQLPCAPENIQAVKDSLRLTQSPSGTLYGKTGTGRIDNQDTNGWFIGFIEISGKTCFFATNLQGPANASGTTAAQTTLTILKDLLQYPVTN